MRGENLLNIFDKPFTTSLFHTTPHSLTKTKPGMSSQTDSTISHEREDTNKQIKLC